MEGLEVRTAAAAERPTIENLMQLYIHDFSEQWRGLARGELGEDGRFEPYPLDGYWGEPGSEPLLIRVAGRLAGFALLNRWSPSGGRVDHNMAEFFIARKHRRAGVGKAAASAILEGHPGRWEVAVARRNSAAQAFWDETVRGCGRIADLAVADTDGARWQGPVYRFRVEQER